MVGVRIIELELESNFIGFLNIHVYSICKYLLL